jgi:hypothetical protein
MSRRSGLCAGVQIGWLVAPVRALWPNVPGATGQGTNPIPGIPGCDASLPWDRGIGEWGLGPALEKKGAHLITRQVFIKLRLNEVLPRYCT